MARGATASLKVTALAALVLTVGLIGGLNDGRGSNYYQLDSHNNRVGELDSPLGNHSGGPVDAALTWTDATAVPGRSVEAVAGENNSFALLRQGSAGADMGADSRGGSSGAQAIICADPWDCFRQGYRDFGGRPEWEEPLVDVLRCESEGYGWAATYPLYISKAQFHPDSWAAAVRYTDLDDPADPYGVGAAVAVWSTLIEHPGGSDGWAECWNVGRGLTG